MKKDVILALIIGLSIGAIIAIAAIRLPLLFEQKNEKSTVVKNTEISPSIALKTNSSLTIVTPKDKSIIDKTETKLSGSASPNSPVIIESTLDSLIIESDKEGNFSTTLKLIEGSNPIYVSAIDTNGDAETKIINLFYTNENL